MIYDSTAIILAGGNSIRFGSNKAFFPWDGEPLVQRLARIYSKMFSRVVVATKEAGAFSFLEKLSLARVVEDADPRQGALVGLCAAMRAVESPHAFVSSCDIPFPNEKLIGALHQERRGHEAVVPVWEGIPQPLFAFYSRDSLRHMEKALAQGEFKLQDLLLAMRAKFLAGDEVRRFDASGLSFLDLDAPSDLARAGAFNAH